MALVSTTTGSNFLSSLEKNNSLQSPASTGILKSSTDNSKNQSSYFALAELAESSNKLKQELINPVLPPILYNLKQLEKQVSSKVKESANDIEARDFTKAHYILAGSGINADETSSLIDQISKIEYLEADKALQDTNLSSYFQKLHDQSILNAIQQSIDTCHQEFESYISKHAQEIWKRRKKTIIDNVKSARSTKKQDRDPKSIDFLEQGSSGDLINGLDLSQPFDDVRCEKTNSESVNSLFVEQKYASVIKEFCKQRMERFQKVSSNQQSDIMLATQFLDNSPHNGMSGSRQMLHDAWKIILHIVQEDPNSSNSRLKRRNRAETARAYRDIWSKKAESIQLRTGISEGSRKFLEQQYIENIEQKIAHHPQIAQVGGVPSLVNKVKGYIRVVHYKNGNLMLPSLEFVNDVPIWAVLFYLFRSGYIEEAYKFCAEHQSWFEMVDKSFHAYLKAYCTNNRRLTRQLNDRIHIEYTQKLRFQADVDPFKRVLYKILGRCDLAKTLFPEILPRTEDYMWLQLILSNEQPSTDDHKHDILTLKDVQNKLLSFGSKHFNPSGQNPCPYFHVLLLSGQFEKAIQYLYAYYPVDAVQYAIVLCNYGLIQCTSKIETRNLIEDNALNYSRLIANFVQNHHKNNPEDAINYLSCICLDESINQNENALKALRDLIMCTKDAPRLLGDIKADGTKTPGILGKHLILFGSFDEKILEAVMRSAAEKALKEGRSNDAILMFHLAEDYNTVARLVCQDLANALLLPELLNFESVNQASLSLLALEGPANAARNVYSMYFQNGSIFSRLNPQVRGTFVILVRISEAYKFFQKEDYSSCLNTLDTLDILPQKDEDTAAIRRKANAANFLEPSIKKLVPILLLISMSCLTRISSSLQQASFSEQTRHDQLRQLKMRSRSIVIFTSVLEFRMPSSFLEQITQMDVLL